jgi:hypothetical protein
MKFLSDFTAKKVEEIETSDDLSVIYRHLIAK